MRNRIRVARAWLSRVPERARKRLTIARAWLNKTGDTFGAWFMARVVWRLVNELALKRAWVVVVNGRKEVQAIYRGQALLREFTALLANTKYTATLVANAWSATPKIVIHEHGVDLFSDLAPLLALLEGYGLKIAHSYDSPDEHGGSRAWNGQRDGVAVVTVTAWLAHHSACQSVPTGELTEVYKFICPGDPEYEPEPLSIH